MGFEPTLCCHKHAFQACAFSHSATPLFVAQRTANFFSKKSRDRNLLFYFNSDLLPFVYLIEMMYFRFSNITSMRISLFIITFFTTLSIFAQEIEVKKEVKDEIDFDAIDSLYREDQFYVNITYNALQKQPAGVTQNKLSTGLGLGFLRDMPINKSRTISIAAGLGYSLSIYNHNLGILETAVSNTYEVLDATNSFSKNKMSLHQVELPVEFRWRNSTPESHIFWRVYSGVKVSYLFYDEYKLESNNGNSKISNNKDLNQIQYGVYLTVGWNTWNFYAYYGLNPIFKSTAKIDNQPIIMNTTNFGLMFYIL